MIKKRNTKGRNQINFKADSSGLLRPALPGPRGFTFRPVQRGPNFNERNATMRSHTEYNDQELALYKALRRSHRKPLMITLEDATLVLAILAQGAVTIYLLRLLLAA